MDKQITDIALAANANDNEIQSAPMGERDLAISGITLTQCPFRQKGPTIMAEPQSTFDEDDDAELELEPIDPEILALEKRRAEKHIDEIVKRVDVDEVLGPVGPHTDLGLDFDFSNWRNFRFTTRHLLMFTAVLAVIFTIFRVAEANCNAVFWMGVIALAAGWYWVHRAEQRRGAERQKQREKILKSFGREDEIADGSSAEGPPWRRFEFKFSFSLRQLFITMTVAAVIVWILTFIPPQVFSLLLGLVAVAGIVAVMAGLEAPPILVLAWWILLVLYILVSIFSQIKQSQAACLHQLPNATTAACIAFN